MNHEIEQLVRPGIRDLKPYSSARDEYSGDGRDMIFLDANENPFDTGVNRYPDPHQRKLKERISELRGVDTGQLLLGNGSDEVLDLLFRVFCEPGRDEVIILPPTYGMYKVLAGVNTVGLPSPNPFSRTWKKSSGSQVKTPRCCFCVPLTIQRETCWIAPWFSNYWRGLTAWL